MDFVNEFNKDELKSIRNEFKRLEGVHYLDHAGATQYAATQINKIFTNFSFNTYSNPHTSKATEDLIDQVRYKILQSFNTTTDEYSVVFTSGATASLKLLAETFDFIDENRGSFMYLRDSHTSVLGMREIVHTKNIKCVERSEFVSGQFLETKNKGGRRLLVFPAQCNFNGFKYPLEVVREMQESSPETYVCLDAASFAASSYLDLSKYPADFICLSFYKLFGYPTGLGALLVAKRAEETMRKKYYGGGTVKIALSDGSGWHQKRDVLHERLEDGTLPYLSIISLLSGYEIIEKLIPAKSFSESLVRLSRHCFNVCQYLYRSLDAMRYKNGQRVVKLYHDTDFSSVTLQGGIVTFNIRHEDGSYVGFAETACMATIHNITLRTGCFCNPGACQRLLELTNTDVEIHYQAGHICGDGNDLIDGVPTGSVRVSVGYMTSKDNVDALISMIEECYLKSSSNRLLKKNKALDESKIIPDEKPPELLLCVERPLSNITEKVNLEGTIFDDQNYALKLTRDSSLITLKQICVFPIKSCGAFRINSSWPLTRRGLKYDREWMIVQSNGVAMTQKADTKLCLICPRIDEVEKVLELHFPHANPVRVPLYIDMRNNKMVSSLCQTKVCGDRVDGIDCGDDVAEWLSDVLCTSGLRLIKQNNSDKRAVKKKKHDKDSKNDQAISLSNQAQFLLINMKSVDWLARRVEEWEDSRDLDETKFHNMVDRFRGNLIVETPAALEELDWKYVQIGNVLLKVDGQCTRCQMICIDQSTGEKTTEPLRTIAREFQGKMRFGLYLGREVDENEADDEIFLHCNSKVIIFK